MKRILAIAVFLIMTGAVIGMAPDDTKNNGTKIKVGGEVFGCGLNGSECFWNKKIDR